MAASRISPTTIISGSCRKASMVPCRKLRTSLPTSRCVIMLLMDLCIYSIGLPIIIMCALLFILFILMIVSRVVLFPEPVIPVIRNKPDFSNCKSNRFTIAEGISRSSILNSFCFIRRKFTANEFLSKKIFPRKRIASSDSSVFTVRAKSRFFCLIRRFFCSPERTLIIIAVVSSSVHAASSLSGDLSP